MNVLPNAHTLTSSTEPSTTLSSHARSRENKRRHGLAEVVPGSPTSAPLASAAVCLSTEHRDDSEDKDNNHLRLVQGLAKRRRRQYVDPADAKSNSLDKHTMSQLCLAKRRFIVENTAIEHLLSDSTAAARILQEPSWDADSAHSTGEEQRLFPVHVSTQVSVRQVTALACTALFGNINKAARQSKMALLVACLDPIVSTEPSSATNCRITRCGNDHDSLSISGSVSHPTARLVVVENAPELTAWAERLVKSSKSGRLDKLIRTVVLSSPPVSTGTAELFSLWSPLDRVLALKLALARMQSNNSVVIDSATSTYRILPAPPSKSEETDPLVCLESDPTAQFPWMPAALAPLPVDLLTHPHLLDLVVSKLTFHFHSTPRSTGDPAQQPEFSFHETLRVMDKILSRLFPYVPTRSVAARAILSHLAAQHRVSYDNSTAQISLISPNRLPTASSFTLRGLESGTTVATLTPPGFALARCCDTGNPMVQSLTRAVWQTLEQRHVRTLPAMLHQLVYFHQDPKAEDAVGPMTESERWITAEYAVWRAWKELKVVGVRVAEPRSGTAAVVSRDSVNANHEPGLEELQARIAQTPFGVGAFDPRTLMLVELANGPAPKKGPQRRKKGEGARAADVCL